MKYTEMIDRVKGLADAEKPLNISAVKCRNSELMQAVFEEVPLRGWLWLLRQAGCTYDSIQKDWVGGAEEMKPGGYCKYGFCLPHWEQQWSPEYLLDRVLEYKRLAYPLAEYVMQELDRPTLEAGVRFFGDWSGVLTRAGVATELAENVATDTVVPDQKTDGLDPVSAARPEPEVPALQNLEPSAYGSKDAVLEALRHRLSLELPVTGLALQDGAAADPELYRAAGRFFGDMRAALRAAVAGSVVKPNAKRRGRKKPARVAVPCAEPVANKTPDSMKPKRPNGAEVAVPATDVPGRKKRFENWEDVFSALNDRRDRGWLNSSSDLRWGANKDTTLYKACCDFFGGVKEALYAAGDTSVHIGFCGKSDVLNALQKRHEAGWSMRAEALRTGAHSDCTLLNAARREFGNVKTAIEAAGLTYDASRSKRFPSNKAVLDALRLRHEAGIPLNSKSFYEGPHMDRTLYNTVCSLFGGMESAARAAGLDWCCERQRRMLKYSSKESVITALRKRLEDGLPAHPYYDKHRNAPLYRACKQLFGSYKAAADAAGLPYGLQGKYADAEAVITELKRWHQLGRLLRTSAINSGPHRDTGLYKACVDHFGGVREAVAAAGLPYEERKKSLARYPDAHSVLVALELRSSSHRECTGQEIRSGKYADPSLYTACCKFFGGVRGAVTALLPDVHEPRQVALLKRVMKRPAKRAKYTTSEAVLNELQRRSDAGQPVNTNGINSGEHRDSTLYVACKKFFGGVRPALKAANIDYSNRRRAARYSCADDVLVELNRRHAAGLPVTAAAIRKGPNRDIALIQACSDYFNGVVAAKKAAGIK